MDGPTMVVTGASSGIGAALARAAAGRGFTVGLVARRQDRLEAVLADCQRQAPESRMWVTDLGDLAAAERFAVDAWSAFDGIDVFVNNAAIPKRRRITDLTEAEVEETMRVNFFSPARMTLALLPKMLERGSGTIVNVSSMGGRLGIIHEAAYSASKFALCGWSESMYVDLFSTPIKVRLIQPGPIDTEIWDQPGNEDPIYNGPKVPPEQVAEGILAALDGEQFEHYIPDMKAVIDMKQQDIDGFLAGTAQMESA